MSDTGLSILELRPILGAMKTVGDIMKDARTRRGLAASEVARAMGKSPSWLSDWENNKKAGPMPPEDLNAVARALHLSSKTLLRASGYCLGDEGPPPTFLPDDPRTEIVDLLRDLTPVEADYIRALVASAVGFARKQERPPSVAREDGA